MIHLVWKRKERHLDAMHAEMGLINILAQEPTGKTRLLNAFPQFHALNGRGREQVDIDRLPMTEL